MQRSMKPGSGIQNGRARSLDQTLLHHPAPFPVIPAKAGIQGSDGKTRNRTDALRIDRSSPHRCSV